MNFPIRNPLVRRMIYTIQHYNPERYWKYREEVINPQSKKPIWLRILYLFYIKRCDAFNNASMGTDLGNGATFATPPFDTWT